MLFLLLLLLRGGQVAAQSHIGTGMLGVERRVT